MRYMIVASSFFLDRIKTMFLATNTPICEFSIRHRADEYAIYHYLNEAK